MCIPLIWTCLRLDCIAQGIYSLCVLKFNEWDEMQVGKSWIMQLLSMACLSLAAKMEEVKVPVLSEFCVEDYSFESNVIQRMELLVLVTLEWKMGSMSPFAYTRFFLEKLRKEDDSDDSIPLRDVLSRIGEVLLDATKGSLSNPSLSL